MFIFAVVPSKQPLLAGRVTRGDSVFIANSCLPTILSLLNAGRIPMLNFKQRARKTIQPIRVQEPEKLTL